MAKNRSLPPAEAILRHVDDQRRLTFRVAPGARVDAIVLPDAGTQTMLQVRITQIAEDGKANAAVLALLAKALGVSRSSLAIVQGATARTKTIRLPD